jgi:hypothetical protein
MEKINKGFYQRGSGDGEGILYLVGFVLVVLFISWIFGFNFHGTSEGTVSYSDCRETITLEPNNWHTYFGTFIGTTLKTKSGKTMGGEFVRIVNDKSFLGNSHTCATAYVYEKKQEGNCTDPTYPYLTYDDMCSTTQY